MRTLYIILSIAGWAWLAVAAAVLPIKLRRARTEVPEASTGADDERTS